MIEGYTLLKVNSPRNEHKKRFGRKCGGVTMYVRDDIASLFNTVLEYATNSIQAIILFSAKLNVVIGTVYRQPDDSQHGHPSTANNFINLLDSIQQVLTDIAIEHSPVIILGGDFNLPNLYNNHKARSKEERLMTQALNSFCLEYSLSQIIQSSTHKDGNILDLLLTNNALHIHSHAVIPTLNSISHHYTMHVATRLFIDSKTCTSNKSKNWETYAKHNFYHKDIKWDNINGKLSLVDWENEFHNKPVDEMLEIFYKLTYQIVSDNAPLKTFSDKKISKTERESRNLTRRRRRINKYLLRITSPQRIKKFHSEHICIEQKLQNLYKNFKIYKEYKAIDAIKSNPKYF